MLRKPFEDVGNNLAFPYAIKDPHANPIPTRFLRTHLAQN